MTVVDSSGWLEYFTGSSLATKYAPFIEKTAGLLVPALVFFEVYRWIKRHRDEEEAVRYAAQMGRAKLIPVNDSLALHAADLSLEYHLPMADSIIYASALSFRAELVTSDADFEKLPSVRYIPKS